MNRANHLIKRTALSICILASFSSVAIAANVKAGSNLASKQNFIFNNQQEPSTIDPGLSSGVYGSRIDIDLFEFFTIL